VSSITQGPIQGITEGDIAQFLANNPAFFERHAELLASVQLTSPHGQRAVSLQERQMEMLRERIKGLEGRIMEMIRHSQENVAIADRLHRWTRTMLLTTDASALPGVAVAELKHQFLIPQAAVRVWGAGAGAGADLPAQPWAAAVSSDIRAFSSSLALPYCGVNSGFEASEWLDDGATVASLAMIPLRSSPRTGEGDDDGCFGMLVLGSPDPTRFAADMGTDFLVRIGDIAGAALVRLLPPR
jgi:uncharacterized protein YigA (DUF484 family)